MRIAELVKELKNNGCFKKRDGTNHEIWYSPITNKKFQIPRHYSDELPTGTEKSIRKQSGVYQNGG